MMHAMDVARTHEILARYRPIAPRPTVMVDNMLVSPTAEKVGGIRIPTKTPKSRKRGRGNFASSIASQKRLRSTYVPVLPSPPSVRGISRALPIFHSVAGIGTASVEKTKEGGNGEMLTLSLLPCSAQNMVEVIMTEKRLDLNSDPLRPAPVEKDLLGTLQKANTVIVPQAVRPVGSSISIDSINQDSDDGEIAPHKPPETKKPEEVEEEVELDPLPAVVSDSNNRVRLANSAYKEMVGQPECLWLDTMMGTGVPALSKRIGGEVMLDLCGSSLPSSSNGFSCRAKIKWISHGQEKLLDAHCDVVRLSCVSKDYLFTWKFHTAAITASPATITTTETF